MKRAITYIDGFNYYFGLREKNWKRFYWTDFAALSRIIAAKHELVATKYFTANIAKPADKRIRQTTFLEAVEANGGVEIIRGQYRDYPHECLKCHQTYFKQNEKMTDVNIAVEMLTDAVLDRFDVAYLITGDSDLTPVIYRIKELHKEKQVIVGFPPKRITDDLKLATQHFYLNHTMIAASQMPDEVKRADGFILERPTSWT